MRRPPMNFRYRYPYSMDKNPFFNFTYESTNVLNDRSNNYSSNWQTRHAKLSGINWKN